MKNTLPLLLLLPALLFAQTVWDGTVNTAWYTSDSTADAYTITTAEQLAGLAQLVNGGNDFNGKTVSLGASIALNDTIGWKSWDEGNAPANEWEAIGRWDSPFNGTFDGKGHTVSGVYINSTDNNQGLFGRVGSSGISGIVRNVGVVASWIRGGNYIGGVVGGNNGGTVENSYFTGTVNGGTVGGVVGENYGTSIVANSYSTGTINGNGQTGGGVVGNNNGTVANSYSTGEVNGNNTVGGVVGHNNGTVVNSYSTGTINGNDQIGGVVGNNYGTTANSYSTGTVSGNNLVGGIAGFNGSNCTIVNSYSTGTVSGNSLVGGVVGVNAGGTVANSYWNSSDYGINNGIGTGLTTTEMQSPAFVTTLNNNISSLPQLPGVTYHPWGIEPTENQGYPILLYNETDIPPPPPPGTEWYNDTSTEFTIYTADELRGFAWLVNAGNDFSGKTVNLGASIALNDTIGWELWETNPPVNEWVAIGVQANPFNGTFDGKGHTVSGVYVNTIAGYQGLFGYTGSGSIVRNVGVVASWLRVSSAYIGGVVGGNNGTVENSYFTGMINGGTNVGGVVGENYGTSIVANSYSTGEVNGITNVGGVVGNNNSTSIVVNSYSTGEISGSSGQVGGVVGNNYGTIANSYSTGTVSGNAQVGGIAGVNSSGTIVNSYSTGIINGTGNNIGGVVGVNAGAGAVTNSYWNSSDYSGLGIGGNMGDQALVTNVSPKTTAEMQSRDFRNLLQKYAAEQNASNPEYMGWQHNAGSYPTLTNTSAASLSIADYFESGNGTQATPYVIVTKQQLEFFSMFVNEGNDFAGEYIELGASIALNDTTGWELWDEDNAPANEWVAIGTLANPFSGAFDGKGHTVSGVYINTVGSNQGLFGRVGSSGIVKNVGVVASWIKGNEAVGSVVGNNSGIVANSYSTGTVSGDGAVGGVVGYNESTVANSYSTGMVNGEWNAGGVVGANGGRVANSYSTGTVSGNTRVGGIVGISMGTITNSYWNTDTHSGDGIGENDRGTITNVTGLTTAQMQSPAFAETLNGNMSSLPLSATYHPWGIVASENQGFPILLYNEIYIHPGTEWYNETDIEFTITTAEQLRGFARLVNGGKNFSGKTVSLGANIVLNDDVANWESWDEDNAPANHWVAIGQSWNNPFNGIFDGKGHTVSGVYINTAGSNQGLFGIVGFSGTVKNVGVISSWIKGDSQIGGVVGYNGGRVANSYSTGMVNGEWDVGGVAGYNGGRVANSYSTSTVSGHNSVGGVVGGGGHGTVANSYSTGTVSGHNSVGGIVGQNSGGTVANSYSTGTVSGEWSVGGVAGYNGGTITNSYWNTDTHSGDGIGENYDTSTNVTGLTTAQMQSPAFAETLNGNMSSLPLSATYHPWGIVASENQGYPTLLYNETYICPSIEWYNDTDTEFTIYTAEQLRGFAWLVNEGNNFNGKTVNLGADIALNDVANWESWNENNAPANRWVAIGNGDYCSDGFGGAFDGKGYAISGVYGNGLFRYIGSSGIVKNVGVVASWIEKDNVVGGVVSRNCGTVANSYFTGTVNGEGYVGGVVGENDGIIVNSYSTGTVSGDDHCAGGVAAGNNYGGTIINSYSTAEIQGDRCAGGVAGYNYSTIANSYFTGTVNGEGYVGGVVGWSISGTITNSYWNTDTHSGDGTSEDDGTITNVTGMTTTEMKSAAFVDILNDNISSLPQLPGIAYLPWGIEPTENQGYPILLLEEIPADISQASITPIPAQTYTGFAITPAVTVSLGETTLLENTDYAVSYSNHTNAGTATVTITGVGNFSGILSANFTISPKPLSSSMLMPIPSREYAGGQAVHSLVALTDGERLLIQGTDYEIEYSNNTVPGTATVTITGKGNYAGIVQGTFEIIEDIQKQLIMVAWGEPLAFTYSGMPQKPSATARDISGVSILLSVSGEETDASDEPYTATATFAAENHAYELTSNTMQFRINKAPLNATLSIADIKAGETLAPRVRGNIGGGSVTYLYSSSENGVYGQSVPSAQGIYFAKAVIDSTKNYLACTTSAVSFSITRADPLQIAVSWGSQSEFEYSGLEQAPSATASLPDGARFELIVSGAADAGSYTATARLAAPSVDYVLTNTEKDFSIKPRPLASNAIEPIDNFYFTGSQIRPGVTVRSGGAVLTPGLDYAVEYRENIIGLGYVTARGLGNYSGEAERIFSISNLGAQVVFVNWAQTLPTFAYSGQEHAPSATAFGHSLEIIGAQSNAGVYTAVAQLSQPSPHIILANSVMPYTISRKELEVSWTEKRSFEFNKMVQAPMPSVEDESVVLRVVNAHSAAGIYTGLLAPFAQIISSNAGNFTLLNNTVDYEITKKPLRAEIENANALSFDTTRTLADIQAYLQQLVTFSGFATNTDTRQTDNASVLSGNPGIALTETEAKPDTLENGFIVRSYSVQVNTSGMSADNYAIQGNAYTIPVASAVLVPVVWSGGTEFEYNGSAQGPQATAGGLEITVLGKQSNAGGYTAVAQLNEDNPRIYLANFSMPYTISQKPVAVEWSKASEYVYNKNTQGPTATLNEPDIDWRISNIFSGAGQYTAENKLAPYVTIISSNAGNYQLTNNSIDYEILRRPLKPYIAETFPEFETNAAKDTLWVSAEIFADSASLSRLLRSLISYEGFATNTETNESDNAENSLSGDPTIQLSYEAAVAVRTRFIASSSPFLSRREPTTQKATAIISSGSITADNYVLSSNQITIIEAVYDDQSTAISCRRENHCTELSPEVCAFIQGYTVPSCAALTTSCLIDSFCITGMLLHSCQEIGGQATASCHTPIIPNRENPKIGVIGVQTKYYNLHGQPLGTAKPTTPGVYIEKHGKHIRKITVH